MTFFFSLEKSIEAIRRLKDNPNLIDQAKLHWICVQFIPRLSNVSEMHLQATALHVYPSTKNTHDITRITLLHFKNDHRRCALFWRLLLTISSNEHRFNEFICSTMVPSSNFLKPNCYTTDALLTALLRRHSNKMHVITLQLSEEEIMRQVMMLSLQESKRINHQNEVNQETMELLLINDTMSTIACSYATDLPALDRLVLNENRNLNGATNKRKAKSRKKRARDTGDPFTQNNIRKKRKVSKSVANEYY